MSKTRPASDLVIIGGWLGCQPRYLKPYEQLYERLGFRVISFVPTPVQIMGCFYSHRSEGQEPTRRTGDVDGGDSPSSMKYLAGRVVESVLAHYGGPSEPESQTDAREVTDRVPTPSIVFHLFSK